MQIDLFAKLQDLSGKDLVRQEDGVVLTVKDVLVSALIRSPSPACQGVTLRDTMLQRYKLSKTILNASKLDMEESAFNEVLDHVSVVYGPVVLGSVVENSVLNNNAVES